MHLQHHPASFAVQAGFGFTLIVGFVSLILLGIVLTQAYNYFVSYPGDKAWMKVYVMVVVMLAFASSVFSCMWEFLLLVENWGVQTAFQDSFWLLALNPLFCALPGTMAHLFFAWRIYVLSSSKILAGVIAFFGIVSTVAAILVSCLFTALKSATATEQFRSLAVVWLVSSVFGDVAITVCLTYQFRRVKSESRRLHREETWRIDHVLNRVLRTTIQNGLVTSMVALTDLVLFFVDGGSPTHTVSFLIPKLYTLTVLSSLNARPVFRDWSNYNVTIVDRDNQLHSVKTKYVSSTVDYSVERATVFDMEANIMKKRFLVDAETAPRMTSAHSPASSLATTVVPSEALPTAPIPLHVAEHNRSRSNTRDGMSRPSAELMRARTPPSMRAPTDSLPPPPPPPAKPLSTTGQLRFPRPSISDRGQSVDEYPIKKQPEFEPPSFPQLQQRARSSSRPRLAEPRPSAF